MSIIVIFQTIADLIDRGESFAAALITLAFMMAGVFIWDTILHFHIIRRRRRILAETLARGKESLPGEGKADWFQRDMDFRKGQVHQAIELLTLFLPTMNGRPLSAAKPEENEMLKIDIGDGAERPSHWIIWKIDCERELLTLRAVFAPAPTYYSSIPLSKFRAAAVRTNPEEWTIKIPDHILAQSSKRPPNGRKVPLPPGNSGATMDRGP